MAGTGGSEKRVALVIGNSVYHHADTLKNPASDAKAISASLARLGFSGTAPRFNLDYNGLRRALQEFGTEADGADMAVIYFAGHGVEVNGGNFLIPVDAKLERSRDVDFETASLDQALNSVDGARQLRLIILDACRNNPFRARMMRSGGTRAIGQGLRSIEPGGNVLVAYAAKHGTFALDGKNSNSPFAEALCTHIEKPGLEIGQLFREVRDDVLERTGREQEPHLYGSLGREMIYLKNPEAENAPAEPAPFDERALELQWWERIKDRDDPAMLEQFLERYPESDLAPLAKDKLCELGWQRLRNSRSIEEFEVFLKRWPGSRFEVQAQKRLAALQRKDNGAGFVLPWRKVSATVIAAGLGLAATYYFWPPADTTLSEDAPTVTTGNTPKNEEPQQTPTPVRNEITDRDGKVLVTYSTADRPNETKWMEPGSGRSFRDCWKAKNEQLCGPEMVVVPAGRFMMGSPDVEGDNDEHPRHEVEIQKPFAVGKFEVTFSDWDRCVSDGGCQYKPGDQGWGRRDRPVINVSWDDITNEYLPWIRKVTGKDYRLLSEAEWEYAARAGTTGRFSFAGGNAKLCQYANHADQSTDYSWKNTNCSDGVGKQTAKVGSFKPNDWGLYDVHGNVWEWVQDCKADYTDTPRDGNPAKETSGCARVLRGGSWDFIPNGLRSAFRDRSTPDYRSDVIGFRIARTLTP